MSPIAWLAARRRSTVTLLLVWLVSAFAYTLHLAYPIHEWLVWRYAFYWSLTLVFCGACLSAGNALLLVLGAGALPLRERLVLGFALGVLAWGSAVFVAGLLQLYGPVFFVGLPLVFCAMGARSLVRSLVRAHRHLRAARPRSTPFWTWVVFAAGLLGVLIVYLPILTPANVQYDAEWKHLMLAENYAVTGGVHRFPEGFIWSTQPQLAAQIFQWAFLLPGSGLFDRIELAAHLEFAVFLWTLASIGPLVRRLVPRARARLVWTTRFLFPGLFVYDSSVTLGADHVAALFAIPAFTALLLVWGSFRPRRLMLLSLFVCGCLLVKYSAALLLVPGFVLAVGVRGAMLLHLGPTLAGVSRRAVGFGLLVFVITSLFVSSQLWLKNWIFHGDPFYPQLHAWLKLEPWAPGSADVFEWGYKDFQLWRPKRTLDGIYRTFRSLWQFSFVPHDWKTFHGKVPVFGSLFTLLLACLPFLKSTRRLWGLAALVHVGIFAWYWVHHQDRYLVAITPLMTAATAAMLIGVWRIGGIARGLLALMVAVQIVWAGHAAVIPAHVANPQPLVAALSALSRRFQDQAGVTRFATTALAEELQAVSRALPAGAKVLVHERLNRLGLERASLTDYPGEQYAISWQELATPERIHEHLRKLGVTHVLYQSHSKGWDTLAGDLAFFAFVEDYGVARQKIGPLVLIRVPEVLVARPKRSDAVLMLGCDTQTFATGAYRVSQLRTPVFGPGRSAFPASEAIPSVERFAKNRAGHLVVDPTCQRFDPNKWGFRRVATRERLNVEGEGLGLHELWMRNP